MIKGCQKRVVWVRNTESEWFDEAYFILSEKSMERRPRETDIMAEANRIISESPFASYWGLEAERKQEPVSNNNNGKLRFKWFSLGMIACAAVSALIMLML